MIDKKHSPALDYIAEDYPIRFGGKVPNRVRMLKTVMSECLPWEKIKNPMVAVVDCEYDVYVNSYGAVSAYTLDGLLGLKPHEFTVVGFHNGAPATSKQ